MTGVLVKPLIFGMRNNINDDQNLGDVSRALRWTSVLCDVGIYGVVKERPYSWSKSQAEQKKNDNEQHLLLFLVEIEQCISSIRLLGLTRVFARNHPLYVQNFKPLNADTDGMIITDILSTSM